MLDRLKNNVVCKQWGYYLTIYYEKNIKIKLLYIQPHSSISLQKHLKRDEIWAILQGEALIRIGASERCFHKYDTLFIEKNTVHKINNKSDDLLIIQETQIGEFNIEEDIIRYPEISYK